MSRFKLGNPSKKIKTVFSSITVIINISFKKILFSIFIFNKINFFYL